MSKTEQLSSLISDCVDRCRASGYTLATLASFLDELRATGQPEAEVQWVDNVMRHILTNVLVPAESVPVELSESPTATVGGELTKVIES